MMSRIIFRRALKDVAVSGWRTEKFASKVGYPDRSPRRPSGSGGGLLPLEAVDGYYLSRCECCRSYRRRPSYLFLRCGQN